MSSNEEETVKKKEGFWHAKAPQNLLVIGAIIGAYLFNRHYGGDVGFPMCSPLLGLADEQNSSC